MVKWQPPWPACPACGGPKTRGQKCDSCDYKPGDPIWPTEPLTAEQAKIRAAILSGLGLSRLIPEKIKKIL